MARFVRRLVASSTLQTSAALPPSTGGRTEARSVTLLMADSSSDTVKLSLSKLDFELGGRNGNVVTTSNDSKVGKGWRLLSINGKSLDGEHSTVVAAAVAKARRSKKKVECVFFGGKLSGGGGMNMDALAKAAQAIQKMRPPSPPAAPSRDELAQKHGFGSFSPPVLPEWEENPPPPPPPSAPKISIKHRIGLHQQGIDADDAVSDVPASKPPMDAHRLRHEFISFDFDRDGALGFQDFLKMLQQLNDTYDFAEVPYTPSFGRLCSQNFNRAGGKRAVVNNPLAAGSDDEDDEEVGVTPAQFNKWYPEFILQCDERKADEYAVSKNMSAKQFEGWNAARTMELRNRSYPLLRGL